MFKYVFPYDVGIAALFYQEHQGPSFCFARDGVTGVVGVVLLTHICDIPVSFPLSWGRLSIRSTLYNTRSSGVVLPLSDEIVLSASGSSELSSLMKLLLEGFLPDDGLLVAAVCA